MSKKIDLKRSTGVRNREIAKGTKAATSWFRSISRNIQRDYASYERVGQGGSSRAATLRSLSKDLAAESKELAAKEYELVRDSVSAVSKAVYGDVSKWVRDVSGGKVKDGSKEFSRMIGSMIDKGRIYKEKQTLSDRIWADANKYEKEIKRIIAGGVARDLSTYEIVRMVQNYVNPNAVQMWNMRDEHGQRIYPARVDYNAHRLVVTTIQHAYQESVIETVKDNPFISKIRWCASGRHPCPLCQSRDGELYDPDELPLDHPNGQCTFEYVYDKDWAHDLLLWQHAPNGTYKEIDAYMEEFGLDLESI